jgi:hypothetical protein
VLAGQHAGLPVLAWALPQAVAGQLKAETSHDFAGHPPCQLDLCVQGGCEHLRWPGATAATAARKTRAGLADGR